MTRTYLLAAGLLAVGIIASTSAESQSFTVDCARGQTIGAALSRGDARKPLVVNVRGTCNEFVAITRGGVTLRGDRTVGGRINGPSSITDTIVILADTVNIERLTVTGGNNGIRLQGPFYAGVRDSFVQDTAGNGILVRAGDIAITNTTVERAGGSGLGLLRRASARIVDSQFLHSRFAGIYAENNSTANVSGGTVSDNGSNGVTLETGSVATVAGATIERNATGILMSSAQAFIGPDNLIRDNRENGVIAQAAAIAGIYENEISGNRASGIVGYLGPTLVLGANEITDNGDMGIYCRTKCTLQITGARITRNARHAIGLQLGSTLVIEEAGAEAGGNYGWVDLWCGDKESSVDGLEYFSGSTFGCTGFDD